jgi:hypothetical protein
MTADCPVISFPVTEAELSQLKGRVANNPVYAEQGLSAWVRAVVLIAGGLPETRLK